MFISLMILLSMESLASTVVPGAVLPGRWVALANDHNQILRAATTASEP